MNHSSARARLPIWSIEAIVISHSNANANDRRDVLTVLGIGAYVLAFYLAELLLKPIPVKGRALAWLLLPDELSRQWVGGHLSRFGVIDRLPILLGAAAILIGGFLLGRLALDLLGADRWLTRLEAVLTSIGVGLNLLSLFTLSMGLAGLLHQQFLFFTVGLLIAGLSLLRRRRWSSRSSDSGDHDAPETCGLLFRLAVGLSAPFALVILLGGMLPPWQFDVREYHSQVPKEWFQSGRIEFLPHNVYGNMPLGAEMHAVLGMTLLRGWCDWWWGALVGKTVIAAFAPLASLSVYALGSRFVSRTAGAVGAFLFISTPWIAHVSMAGLIEGAYAFYLVLAVHLIMMVTWKRPGQTNNPAALESRPARSLTLVVLSGFLAGSAVACKYPALLFVVAPLLLWTTLVPFGSQRAKRLAVFALGVVLACGLWFGKNWVQTGNPTYPLLYEWFDGRTRTVEKHEQWSRAHRAPANGWSVARLASSVTTVALTSDYLSPLLVPLGVLGVCSLRHWRIVLPLGALLVLVFAAWWLLTHRIDRFLLPLLPLAAVLAGVGATWSNGVVWRRCLTGLLVWCLLANLSLTTSRDVSDNRFLVRLRELRRDRESVHDPGYFHLHRAHDRINSIVRPGFAALLVGEAQVFNIQVPALYNTCFDDCIFEALMKARGRAERLEVFRERRISHVFFFWRELDRYRSPGNYGYSDYATQRRVHHEFVEQQGLLRPVPVETDSSSSELFEVVGWQDFAFDATEPP